MTKKNSKNGWWTPETEDLDIPDLFNPEFHIDKPWEVIEKYPEMAWKVLKKFHDELEKVKAENNLLRAELRANDLSKTCGEK